MSCLGHTVLTVSSSLTGGEKKTNLFSWTFLVIVSEELALIIIPTVHSALFQAGDTKEGLQGVLLVGLAGGVVAGAGHWRGCLANTNQEHQDSQYGVSGYIHVLN